MFMDRQARIKEPCLPQILLKPGDIVVGVPGQSVIDDGQFRESFALEATCLVWSDRIVCSFLGTLLWERRHPLLRHVPHV